MVLLLASCGDDSGEDAETGDSSSSSEAEGDGGDSQAASIPEGTVLRVADQAEFIQGMMTEAGELEDVPYEIDFSDFLGGPPINEAFAAGAIDVGNLYDTPAVHNLAAELDTVVVSVLRYDGTGAGLYARDDSGIESLEDLEGSEIAYARGTNSHGFMLRALDTVGLDESDITPVDVPITDLAQTVSQGHADAGTIFEHAMTDFVDDNPDAVEVATYGELVDIYGFLLASQSAVDDPAVGAALEDFVARYSRSMEWVNENSEEFAQTYYVDSFGLTPEAAEAVSEAVGFPEIVEIDDEVQDTQQELADLFYEAGEMPQEVDMADQFDPEVSERFNAVLASLDAAAGSARDNASEADE